MDNDSTAKTAYEQLKKEDLIDDKDVIFAMVSGKEESEFEDLLQVGVYSEFIPTTLEDWKKYINNKKKKWSENIKNLYEKSGVPLNLEELKNKISTKIVENPSNVLDRDKSSTINALIGTLETILKKD